MRYKTIVLELLQEQYPALHERLRASRTLLQAVNDHATALRTAHLAWVEEFRQANPGYDPAQIASEALEPAIADLQAALPSESPPSGEWEGLSLDAAMASLCHPPTPTA